MSPNSTASWTLRPTKPRLVNPLDRLTRNSYPGILCGIIILILTGLPGSVFPRVKPVVGFDKVVHFFMYAVFAFACVWGYRKQYVARDMSYKKKALLVALAVSIAYGGLTELMQEYFVPMRTGDWIDFLADTMGTLSGILVFYLFFRQKK